MLLARLQLRYLRPRVSPAIFTNWRWQSTAIALTASVAPPIQASPIRLRPYQEECIQKVLSYVEQGHKRLGLSLATGSGKTVVFTRLIERIPPSRPDATQTLILAHRQELVDQAYRHCKLAYPDKWIEIEKGKSHASGSADITVASVQSISSQDRIEKFDPSRFKLVLVDEAHHIVASSYLKVLKYFNLRPVSEDCPVLVGVSATFARADGKALGAAIDHIVYHKDYVEMINEQWLSDVMFTTVAIKVNLDKVKVRNGDAGGDFQIAELSRAVNTPELNEATFLAWQERAAGRRSTLVFCVDVKHVCDLAATFRQHGVKCEFVTGETKTNIRSDILDGFKRGDFPVLLNCGVFTEGTDIPNIDCVLLARPTRSRSLLIQMIGRGTRLYPGKENCHVIDLVASLKTGIQNTPTLFGLDPDEVLQNATMGDMEKRKNQKKEEELSKVDSDRSLNGFSGIMTYTDYDSLEDLLGDTSGEQHIRAISQFAWVQVDEHRYILSTNSGNYMTLLKSDETSDKSSEETSDMKLYHVDYTAKLPGSVAKKSPYARPRTVAKAQTFEDAVHAADSYAATVFQYQFIARNQPWRRSPASEAQLKALNKARGSENQLEPGDLTKGQANDMITKLKFGAKGRYDKMATSRQKAIREQESVERSLQKMKDREEVKVGPVGRADSWKESSTGKKREDWERQMHPIITNSATPIETAKKWSGPVREKDNKAYTTFQQSVTGKTLQETLTSKGEK